MAAGCADLSRGHRSLDASSDAASNAAGDGATGDTLTGDDGGTSGDVALSFATAIHGLVTTSCMPCHAQGQQAGSTSFLLTGDTAADYASVSSFIDTGTPASSRLLAKMSGHGHGGGTLFATDSPEYQTVLRWIQEGAPP